MWRHLVAKEEFSLIGEPLHEEHLIKVDQGTQILLENCGVDAVFDLWVSGHYSAATDGLSLEISQLAMEGFSTAMTCGKSQQKCLVLIGSNMVRTTRVCLMLNVPNFLKGM